MFLNNINLHFFNLKKLNTNKNNFTDALIELLKNNEIDSVSFVKTLNIVPNNLSVLYKNLDGKYYIDIELKKDIDIITNFKINRNDVKLSLVINSEEEELNNNSLIYTMLTMYTPLALRFTFLNEPVEFIFTNDSYICKNNVRNDAMKQLFISDNYIYSSGCMKKKILN